MNKLIAIGVGTVLLVLLLVFSTTYSVSYHDVAIKRTFGKSTVDDVSTDPGLKLKLPILQNAQVYDTRTQVLETPFQEVALSDGQQVVVKAFMLWRIDGENPQNTLAFDRSFGSMKAAEDAMRAPFTAALAGALSSRGFDDLIGADHQLEAIEQEVLAVMKPDGVKVASVGISQVMLPERTSNAVILRMNATRERLAENYRQTGMARAAQIQSSANTQADKIRAFAEALASDIKSRGQEDAVGYIAQMQEEEELAIFLVWLDALEASLSENTTFVLNGDFEPWHLMKSPRGARGIPQPGRGATAVATGDGE